MKDISSTACSFILGAACGCLFMIWFPQVEQIFHEVIAWIAGI